MVLSELANLISGMPLSARRAVGCEKKTLQTLARLSPLMDYQTKRAEAEKVRHVLYDLLPSHRTP